MGGSKGPKSHRDNRTAGNERSPWERRRPRRSYWKGTPADPSVLELFEQPSEEELDEGEITPMDESTDTEELDDEPNTEDRAFLKNNGEQTSDGEYVPTDPEDEEVDADRSWGESKSLMGEKDEKVVESESTLNSTKEAGASKTVEVRRQLTPEFEQVGGAEVQPKKDRSKEKPKEKPKSKPPKERAERNKPPDPPDDSSSSSSSEPLSTPTEDSTDDTTSTTESDTSSETDSSSEEQRRLRKRKKKGEKTKKKNARKNIQSIDGKSAVVIWRIWMKQMVQKKTRVKSMVMNTIINPSTRCAMK